LPSGEDPFAIQWPRVRFWIGRCDDLEPGLVVRLAGALVRDGGEVVILTAKAIDGGVLLARRRSGHGRDHH
jgi:hypothetical protein